MTRRSRDIRSTRAGALARSLASGLLAAAQAPIAFAEPLQPNRPGQADPPTVLSTGVVQIEGGSTFERQTDGAPNTDTLTLPELELRIGVRERIELQLFVTGLVHEDQDGESNDSGMSDIELDARVLLSEQVGLRPAVAVDFGVSIPTGSGFATSDGVDPEAELLIAWDVGTRWNLNGNLDVASESQGEDESGRNFVFRPQLALGLTVNERAGLFIEYYGVIEEDTPNQHSADAGATFLVTDDLQLDISAGAGLNDEAPDFFVSAGVAWRL